MFILAHHHVEQIDGIGTDDPFWSWLTPLLGEGWVHLDLKNTLNAISTFVGYFRGSCVLEGAGKHTHGGILNSKGRVLGCTSNIARCVVNICFANRVLDSTNVFIVSFCSVLIVDSVGVFGYPYMNFWQLCIRIKKWIEVLWLLFDVVMCFIKGATSCQF